MERLHQFSILWLFAGLILLLNSCNDQPERKEKESAIVEKIDVDTQFNDEDFKGLWKNVKALWEKRQDSIVHKVYADEFIRVSPAGEFTNAEELSQELQAIEGAYPDLSLDMKSYDLCEDKVIVIWTVSGTFTGELMGLKGNGAKFKNKEGITIFTLVDGKVVDDRSYWDSFMILRDVGYQIKPGK